MADRDDRLIGSWHKAGDVACAAGYAAHLRIEAGGLYFGSTEPPGEFTWWDGGTWRVIAQGQLALSTANDAVVLYTYTLQDDTLTIVDAAGCRFSYRRAT
jgi:YD repeat-containing protein